MSEGVATVHVDSEIMCKKVLFLIETLSGGGAEKVLVTLLNNINTDMFDVTLCVITDVGVHKKNLNKNIKYIALNRPGNSVFAKWRYKIKYNLIYKWLPLAWVYKLFVPKDNDVEIAFVEGFATRLLAHSSNRMSRKIAWVHTDLINNHWTRAVFADDTEEAECYSKYETVVGVSQTATNSVKTLYSIKNAITLYNPIDSEYIISAAAQKIERKQNGRIKLVTAGRLVHQKGYDRLLRVMNRLVCNQVDVELLILGEGPDRATLKNYIKDNNLADRISMPGFVDNPYSRMAECDLFVCSSRSEGYSTAVTEALIVGLPVVTTECSGMRELLMDGEYGVITNNDEEPLYEALYDVLTSAEKLSCLKKKALVRGEHFNLKKLMTSIEDLLAK